MQRLISAYNRILEHVDCSFVRYLHDSIDWSERLIGIKGARGAGKTTLLLQHIKLAYKDPSQAFYASLDHIWFNDNSLSDLVEYLYTHGVTTVFLDEIHRYKPWVREIKNIYDSYPDLKVVFTGSSVLEIDSAEADLSRRVRMYNLDCLSFREYLAMSGVAKLPAYSLDDILSRHQAITSSVAAAIKPLPHFETYCKWGFYPFFLDAGSKESYFDRLQRTVSVVLERDVPAVEEIGYDTIHKCKRLLLILAQKVPFAPNVSSLCETLSTTRNQLIRLLTLLERARLIRMLYYDGKHLKSIGKPEKILFDNPNLMYALADEADAGAVRESFFASMLGHGHQISYPKAGDLSVDGKFLFEVGGRNKGFDQIKDIPDSYVAADGIETGFGNKIPLWTFGLLY